MILHELFFASLGAGGEPEDALREALVRDFKSVANWRTEFAAIGKALRGGSGWVLLSWSPRDQKLVNQWAMDHTTTWRAASRSLRSICTSIRITWITGRRPPPMLMPLWPRSTGRMWRGYLPGCQAPRRKSANERIKASRG